MNPPSIGLFTYSVKPRGSVVHAACLAEALARRGADVTLYALSRRGDGFFRPLACRLVPFAAEPAPAESDLLIAQRIRELHAGLARAAPHDVYHAEDCLTASALIGAASVVGRPVVRTVHHVERFESVYLMACQRRSIELSDSLVSVSACTARDVRAEFGRESTVIYNGVASERFAAVSAGSLSSAGLRARPLRDDDFLVLSVGGVEPRKNTLRALEAVIRAGRDNPRLRWLVVGGASIWDHSELERRFDARVAELPEELRERITRLGPVDEATLGQLYARSDVLLAPSLHEGWGLAVLEAMLAKTAVICSAREPFTEYLDETRALLVDPESTESIAGALTTLDRDATLRARLARNAECRARDFSWDAAARAHLELYTSLACSNRTAVDTHRLPAA